MNKARDLVCINCPRGCSLHIDENLNVTGNFCPRGKAYAISEVTNPTRTVTSTVYIVSDHARVCSCKTNNPIPKKLIFEVMKEIDGVKCHAPIKIGDIIIKNVCNTGVDVVATEDINS
jgi:CxxC motif-containing protein